MHKVVIPPAVTRNIIYRDPLLFPNFIHTQKRNPTTHLKVNAWHLHLLQKGVHHRQVLAALLFCTLDLYLVWDVLLIRLILKLCHAGSFSCCWAATDTFALCQMILLEYFMSLLLFQDPDMFWDFITLRPETTHQER